MQVGDLFYKLGFELDLSGIKIAEKSIASLGNGFTAALDESDTTSESKDGQEEIWDTVKEVGATLKELWDSGNGIADLFTKTFDSIEEVFDNVKEQIEPLKEAFEKLDVKKQIGTYFDSAKDKVTEVFDFFKNANWTEDFSKNMQKMIGGLGQVTDVLDGIAKNGFFNNVLKPLFDDSVIAILDNFDSLKETFNNVKNKIGPLFEPFKETFDKIKDKIEPIIEPIKDVFSDIKDKVEPIIEPVKDVFSDIKEKAGPILEPVKDVFGAVKEKVFEKGDWAGTLSDVVKKVVSGLEKVKDIWGKDDEKKSEKLLENKDSYKTANFLEKYNYRNVEQQSSQPAVNVLIESKVLTDGTGKLKEIQYYRNGDFINKQLFGGLL